MSCLSRCVNVHTFILFFRDLQESRVALEIKPDELGCEGNDNIEKEDGGCDSLPHHVTVDSTPQSVGEKSNELWIDEGNETLCNTYKKEVPSESSTPSNNLEKVSVDIQPSTLESPQSPVFVTTHELVKVESDLSSDEEFKDNIAKEAVHCSELCNRQEKHMIIPGSALPVSDQANLCTQTSKYLPGEEVSDGKLLRRDLPKSTKQRLLPRQYQIEEQLGPQKQELPRLREHKEPSRIDKRHYPGPRSPSPRGHHRRYRHSPPPEYMEKRWHHRNRPLSPGVCIPHQFSRSPPGCSGSPPHRRYSTSPPPRCKK